MPVFERFSRKNTHEKSPNLCCKYAKWRCLCKFCFLIYLSLRSQSSVPSRRRFARTARCVSRPIPRLLRNTSIPPSASTCSKAACSHSGLTSLPALRDRR